MDMLNFNKAFEYNQNTVMMLNIINRAKMFNVKGEFQKHHIIPRAYFRKNSLPIDNSESNLVNLTFYEHAKVHKLIVKCCNDSILPGMKRANNFMNGNDNIGDNNPMFGRRLKEFMSEAQIEEWKKHVSDASAYKRGYKVPEDVRKRTSERNKEMWSKPEYKERLRVKMKEKFNTDEYKNKMRKASSGRKLVTGTDGKHHWAHPTDVEW